MAKSIKSSPFSLFARYTDFYYDVNNLFLEIENICKKEFKKNINFLNDNLFQDFSNKKYFLSSLEKDLKIKLKKNKKR